MRKTMIVLILSFFVFVSAGVLYAGPPEPNPALPVKPVKELPIIKPPAIPPKPDLRIGLFNIRPDWTRFYPGNPGMSPQTFKMAVQVLNGGSAVTGCEVDVVLSNDGKVSADDRLLERIVYAGMIPPGDARRFGEVWVNSRDFNISEIPAGTYNICARVDPLNRTAESNESNNDSASCKVIIVFERSSTK